MTLNVKLILNPKMCFAKVTKTVLFVATIFYKNIIYIVIHIPIYFWFTDVYTFVTFVTFITFVTFTLPSTQVSC